MISEYWKQFYRYSDFLSSYIDFDTSLLTSDEIVLSAKISKEYAIEFDAIAKMVLSVKEAKKGIDISLSNGTNTGSYSVDEFIKISLKEGNNIIEYINQKQKIKSILFKDDKTAIKIENPELIDLLLKTTLEYYTNFEDVPTFEKIAPKNWVIKLCAIYLFSLLTMPYYKMGNSQARYIIGEIFAFYSIGLIDGKPILNENQYKSNYDESEKYSYAWKIYLDDQVSTFLK